MDASPAFAGEVEIVDAEVHLGLVARPGLEARHGRRRRSRPQLLDPFADDRVSTREAARPQLLQRAFAREIRIAAEQFLQHRLERIEQPRASPRRNAFG